MKKAGDILKDFLGTLNIKEKSGRKTITSSWKEIAGEELSEHTKIKDIRKDTIYIEADHPGWLQILDLKKKAIIFNINKMFPDKKIEQIRTSLKR